MTQCKFTFLSTWPQLLTVERKTQCGTIRLSQTCSMNLTPKNENHAVAPLPVDIRMLLGGDSAVYGK